MGISNDVQEQIPVERLERICQELETFRRSDEVNTDNAAALADLLEEIVAPYAPLRCVACTQCGREFVEGDDGTESTYCGSFCTECLPAHLEECAICREDFQ
jgi:hypothetical protein